MFNRPVIIYIFICLAFFSSSSSSAEDLAAIMSMDISSPENRVKLNDYLSGDNILAYLKVRERLITRPYAELKMIRNEMGSQNAENKLMAMIDGFISKAENEHVMHEKEDIIINNIPQSLSSPFYGDFRSGSGIRELKPHAERIYAHNLRLRYVRDEMIEKDNGLWVNSKRKTGIDPYWPARDKTGYGLNQLNNNEKVVHKWSYRFKYDNAGDFFFNPLDLRQWIKRFEDNPIFPVRYENTLILRNEYRVFCLDLKTGSKIWSLGDFDKSSHEFYYTFRHPQQNSRGYEFLLSDKMFFAELDNRLIALDLNNILRPGIAWQKELGEFTSCTKPVLNKGVLIIGLINSRGEIYVCGFSALDGGLKWDAYIGTSSSLSSVCSVSYVNGDQVILGTNHGVIISVDSSDGSIAWIKRYLPKKYNILEYWSKSCPKEFPNDKCPIKYDTDFIHSSGGTVYYKPRESDYLYIFDLKTGETKKQILIDPEKFYILWANQGRAIFLQKPDNPAGKTSLKMVDLDLNRDTYKSEIKGVYLYGVSYLSDGVISFKLDDVLYLLKLAGNSVGLRECGSNLNGWLVNGIGNNLFIADGDELSGYELGGPGYKNVPDLNGTPDPIKRQVDLLKDFREALKLNTKVVLPVIKKRIFTALQEKSISLEELMPAIADNLEKLKDVFWNDLIQGLLEKHSDEIVSYNDVNLRFGGFLYGAGLSEHYYKDESKNMKNAAKAAAQRLEISGEGIAPLRITVIIGDKEPEFYLIRRFDQLVCVDEAGSIIWFRKVFRNCEAYLYDNTLIIKDDMNITGLDSVNGKYLWSVTRNRDASMKSGLRNPGSVFDIKFIEGDCIIILENKMYSLDPVTGYCGRPLYLGSDDIKSIDISGGLIYLLSPSLKNIRIYGRDMVCLGELLLDFINSGEWDHEILFIGRFMVLRVNYNVYLIDLENKKLSSKFFMGDKGKYFLDVYGDNLLRVIPSKSVSSYRLAGGSLTLDWEYDFKNEGKELWGFGIEKNDFRFRWDLYDPEKERYYFILKDKIFMPYRSGAKYYMLALDLSSGKEKWRTQLTGVNGVFDGISAPQEWSGRANFIISTKCPLNPPATYAEYMKYYIVDAKPQFLSIDLNRGNILKTIDLPLTYKDVDYIRSTIIQTKNCYIYGVHNKFIISEIK